MFESVFEVMFELVFWLVFDKELGVGSIGVWRGVGFCSHILD